mgnify:CR=1 FL=1
MKGEKWVPQKPDYPKWLQRRTWTLIEAACLLCDVEPPDNFDTQTIDNLIHIQQDHFISNRYQSLEFAIEIDDLTVFPSQILINGEAAASGTRLLATECVGWAINESDEVPIKFLRLWQREKPWKQKSQPTPEEALLGNVWDETGLIRLHFEYSQAGATQAKLADKYGVSRQRIGRLLKKAEELVGTPQKATPFDQLRKVKNKGRRY